MRSRPPFTGVPKGTGRKVPHGVLFECFWAPALECPKECFSSAFLALLFGAKKLTQALNKHCLGDSEAGAQKHSKKHSVGHFPARAPEAPVNGDRDRKSFVPTSLCRRVIQNLLE